MLLQSYQQVRDRGGFWSSLNNVHIVPFLCHPPPPIHFKNLYNFASNISKCCIFIVTSLVRRKSCMCKFVHIHDETSNSHVWSFLFQRDASQKKLVFTCKVNKPEVKVDFKEMQSPKLYSLASQKAYPTYC